ncbi:hypothetical protein [Candidatus Nitrotoga sp. 1052]|uniref:hypothetical protein n=1 Tax=Candidatus Nitrotoga sp. 1052 TaxID=2886964 RepID=UPI001EF5673D|nr:hypothetical protein [Candidatus Nitrotoga sp. 1052]
MSDINGIRLQTLMQVKAFPDGTTQVTFRVPKAERNRFIECVLKRFDYAHNMDGATVPRCY